VTGAVWAADDVVGEDFGYAKESATMKVEIDGCVEAKEAVKRVTAASR
jgi:hypothetical protein